MNGPLEASKQQPVSQQRHSHVVLFYRYFLPTHHAANGTSADNQVQQADGILDETTLLFFQTHAKHYLPLLQHHQNKLCESLGMKGRILLSKEGINGTLSCHQNELKQYQKVMHDFDLLSEFNPPENINAPDTPSAGQGRLFTNIDWKISTINTNQIESNQEPFPDLKVSIVKEIVNTGGTIDACDIPMNSGREISPEEFHGILMEAEVNGGWVGDGSDKGGDGGSNSDGEKKEVVLIDVRNTFEHAIGHFVHPHSNTIIPNEDTNSSSQFSESKDNEKAELQSTPQTSTQTTTTPALNPNTVTFSHFDSNFCSKYSSILANKKVLMYCTGGIRCVKASAMLKKRGVLDVSHLSGGIHRYLEKYSNEGFYKGKCMVFDQRVALDGDSLKVGSGGGVDLLDGGEKSEKSQVVGKCIECQMPYDQLSGANLCTVCRDLILICPKCRETKYEYHCDRHQSWKNAYFTFLDCFTVEELQQQKLELQRIHDSYVPPKEHKNVRRTLRKQLDKVHDRIIELENGSAAIQSSPKRRCRTCFESSDVCDGLCWGFWKHSQSTNQQREEAKLEPIRQVKIGDRVTPGPHWNEFRLGSKYSTASASGAKKAKTVSESNAQLQQPKDSDAKLKIGTVVQLKSWGSGGNELDCVAVQWDEITCSSHGRRKRGNCKTSDVGDETTTHQAAIYRWGAVARNGSRMYDVELIGSI